MKQLGKTAAFWAAVLLVWETAFHCMVFGGLSARFLSAVPLTLGLAGLLAVLSHLWPAPSANQITRFLLLTALLAVFAVQTVYYQIFGSLLSLAYLGLGGDAVGNFLPIVIDGIVSGLPLILLCLLPYPLLFLLQRRGLLSCAQMTPAGGVLLTGCAVLVSALGVPAAGSEGRGAVYYDLQTTVDRQAEYFGLLTAERLELGRLLSDDTGLSGAADLQGGGEGDRNIMPQMDFEALNAAADSDALRDLNNYFASLSGTAKNEYTGLFSGYNYIQICAESYSPYLVDPDLTPTLYRLTHEGIVFDNFYNSFSSVTSNGEYSLCMGLMPDLSRLSFSTSVDNYVPFTLAHLFTAQEGRAPLAYHNNYATFYNRINTHTNMGYDFRGIHYGLDMAVGRPSSDLEMMEKTVDDYIHDEPFAVHYMTYSGHAPYNFSVNAMSAKNQERVRALGLDCSEELLAYYACQLELEDAVTYLLSRLEQAGIAGHTVVVLTGDHLPYGMNDESYRELAGAEAVESDPFWRFRNSFVCWTGSLSEPIHVDDYCCTQDILPTICNLFGLTYESRMLTGTDVLSSGTHIALLQNGSFLTDTVTYDSDSGTFTYAAPAETAGADPNSPQEGREPQEEYAQRLLQATRNQFSVSAAILRTDYYGFVFSTLSLADSTAPVITDQHSFSDLDGKWYADSVERLIGRGGLSATNDGRFDGDKVCTRSMFLSMLVRILYLEPVEGQTPPFTDMAEDTWYYPQAAAAWAAGIIPWGDSFRPLDLLTEEDARAIFAGAALYAGVPNAGLWANQVIDEVMTRDWTVPASPEAPDSGSSLPAGEESPAAFSRGAAAAIAARLLDATE